MSGMRNEQRAYKPPAPPPPLEFTKGRLVYTSRLRRRGSMYRLAAALLILAVGIGVVVVLLPDWLSTMMK
jgi:hypothetical protein